MKILACDDDAFIIIFIETILRNAGHEVTTAASGQDAINLYRMESPDLVLLDLVMPDMGGYDCLSEIKRINPKVPVIIVTGYADVEAAVKLIKAGAFDILTKPFETEKLLLTIELAYADSRRIASNMETNDGLGMVN